MWDKNIKSVIRKGIFENYLKLDIVNSALLCFKVLFWITLLTDYSHLSF